MQYFLAPCRAEALWCCIWQCHSIHSSLIQALHPFLFLGRQTADPSLAHAVGLCSLPLPGITLPSFLKAAESTPSLSCWCIKRRNGLRLKYLRCKSTVDMYALVNQNYNVQYTYWAVANLGIFYLYFLFSRSESSIKRTTNDDLKSKSLSQSELKRTTKMFVCHSRRAKTSC